MGIENIRIMQHESDPILDELNIDINRVVLNEVLLVGYIQKLSPFVKGYYSSIAEKSKISRQHLTMNVFKGKVRKISTLHTVWHFVKDAYITQRKLNGLQT